MSKNGQKLTYFFQNFEKIFSKGIFCYFMRHKSPKAIDLGLNCGVLQDLSRCYCGVSAVVLGIGSVGIFHKESDTTVICLTGI